MSYYCKLCDKPKLNKSKNEILKSITHKILSESNMRRYITQNPNINDIDEIMRKYIVIYIRKL